MSHCIAIASGKGGVGKSTLTANLGAALSQRGRKVVLIDADIGLRSLDALLSLENTVVSDSIDVVSGDCELDHALLASETYPDLFLLPAAQFRRAKALDPKQLRKFLSLLRVFYDYILIDCPAGIERGLRNVLNAGVDETILVTTPDDISLRSAERARQVIESKFLPRPRLIVNRLDADVLNDRLATIYKKVGDEVDAAIREGRTVDAAEIRDRVWKVKEEQSDKPTLLDWIAEQVPLLDISDDTRKHYG